MGKAWIAVLAVVSDLITVCGLAYLLWENHPMILYFASHAVVLTAFLVLLFLKKDNTAIHGHSRMTETEPSGFTVDNSDVIGGKVDQDSGGGF